MMLTLRMGLVLLVQPCPSFPVAPPEKRSLITVGSVPGLLWPASAQKPPSASGPGREARAVAGRASGREGALMSVAWSSDRRWMTGAVRSCPWVVGHVRCCCFIRKKLQV